MLRHYKFIIPETRYTFYIPIHDPKPFDPDDDVLSQIMIWLKAHDINKHQVVVLQTSTRKVNMTLKSWIMSKLYESELRAI